MTRTRRAYRVWRHLRDHPRTAFLGLLVAFLVTWYVNDRAQKIKLEKAQLAACQRGNLLREEINARIAVTRAERTAFLTILPSVAANATDAAVRRQAASSLVIIVATKDPRELPLIDCHQVVFHPKPAPERRTPAGTPAT